jgi:hypothetical protein
VLNDVQKLGLKYRDDSQMITDTPTPTATPTPTPTGSPANTGTRPTGSPANTGTNPTGTPAGGLPVKIEDIAEPYHGYLTMDITLSMVTFYHE